MTCLFTKRATEQSTFYVSSLLPSNSACINLVSTKNARSINNKCLFVSNHPQPAYVYRRVQMKSVQWRNFEPSSGAASKPEWCLARFIHIGVGRTTSQRPISICLNLAQHNKSLKAAPVVGSKFHHFSHFIWTRLYIVFCALNTRKIKTIRNSTH